MGKVTGSWLEGPRVRPNAGDQSYAGARLGLPMTGRGSVAGSGRRLGALFVDWIVCMLIASVLTQHAMFGSAHPVNPLAITAVFAVEYVALLATVGSTIGMRVFGIGVRRLDGHRLGVGWVVVRTILLLLVIPAVIYDRDQRGLHDKAAASVAVRL